MAVTGRLIIRRVCSMTNPVFNAAALGWLLPGLEAQIGRTLAPGWLDAP
jgi:hypothetical protein